MLWKINGKRNIALRTNLVQCYITSNKVSQTHSIYRSCFVCINDHILFIVNSFCCLQTAKNMVEYWRERTIRNFQKRPNCFCWDSGSGTTCIRLFKRLFLFYRRNGQSSWRCVSLFYQTTLSIMKLGLVCISEILKANEKIAFKTKTPPTFFEKF